MKDKLYKSFVQYVDDHGDGDEQCAKCAHFRSPASCQIVGGLISPQGWCNRFESREDEAAASSGVDYQRPVHAGSLKGAYRLPRSAIVALGNGDHEAGLAASDELFGWHRALGRATVHPDVVRYDGDIETGHRVLKNFINMIRKDHDHAEQ